MNIVRNRFLRDESGVTSVEYAVVALLVALVVIAGITAVGSNLAGMYGNVASRFPALPA
jgi:pilus assembly protein Flp/PilA